MTRSIAALLFVITVAASALAEPQKATPANGFRAEFLANFDDVQSKIVSLAQAVPPKVYAWRPAKGVRSMSEVLMHVAGGNYFLATFLGVQPPKGTPQDLEKIVDKPKVLAELKRSFDHVRASAAAMTDAELEKKVKMFGNQTTHRGVYVTILNHLHEHLGQSIAYARMNGIAPPWSR